MSGSEWLESQARTAIELPVGSPFARSLQSAAELGEPVTVGIGDMTYTVSIERSTVDEADREAVLAAAGSWKDVIDGDALKKQLKDARGSKRSSVTL
jgi:hypothetical protein